MTLSSPPPDAGGRGPSLPIRPPIGVPRLFAARGPDYHAHLERFGPLDVARGAIALRTELPASGLSGRGGAGFPVARKVGSLLRAAADRGAPRSVVIGNGAEGEPLSAKDACLIRIAPHTIIDGLLLAGALVGSGDLTLYARPEQLAALSLAITERSDAASIRLVASPDTFVSGEASAVAAASAGRPPLPIDHIVPLSESGPRRRPTLVQNVESLANLALIARFGAGWFRSIGTGADPGTRLISVTRCDGTGYGDPRVIEVQNGIPLADAIRGAGLALESVSAVLVGGFYGTWVPRAALTAELSRDGLAPWGASPGAGMLMTLDASRCPLAVAADIASYLAAASARQCGPCANGLPALSLVVSRLAAREPTPALASEIRRLSATVTGRGACHHPDGTARFVLSTLDVFESEVEAHLRGACVEVRP